MLLGAGILIAIVARYAYSYKYNVPFIPPMWNPMKDQTQVAPLPTPVQTSNVAVDDSGVETFVDRRRVNDPSRSQLDAQFEPDQSLPRFI